MKPLRAVYYVIRLEYEFWCARRALRALSRHRRAMLNAQCGLDRLAYGDDRWQEMRRYV